MRRVALALLLSGCGATFESVSATGKLGAGLSEHGDAVSSAAPACRILTAVAMAPAECAAAEKTAKPWQRALRLLSRYGARLKAVAEADAPPVSEPLARALLALSAADLVSVGEADGKRLGAATEGILGVLSKTFRHEKVVDAVEGAQVHVAQVAALLDGHLARLLAVYAALDTHVAGELKTRRRCQIGQMPPKEKLCLADNAADIWTKLELVTWIAERRDEIVKARVAIEAFEKSHARLHENVGALETRDRKIYEDIARDVASVYENFDAYGGPK